MAERDVLARLIADGLDSTKNLDEWSIDYQDEMRHCADVILAAGYRRPADD